MVGPSLALWVSHNGAQLNQQCHFQRLTRWRNMSVENSALSSVCSSNWGKKVVVSFKNLCHAFIYTHRVSLRVSWTLDGSIGHGSPTVDGIEKGERRVALRACPPARNWTKVDCAGNPMKYWPRFALATVTAGFIYINETIFVIVLVIRVILIPQSHKSDRLWLRKLTSNSPAFETRVK